MCTLAIPYVYVAGSCGICSGCLKRLWLFTDTVNLLLRPIVTAKATEISNLVVPLFVNHMLSEFISIFLW